MSPPDVGLSPPNVGLSPPGEGAPTAPLPAVRGGQLPQARPPVPSRLSAGPDAVSLLKSLRRRWGLAVSLGIVCSAAVGVATWMALPASKYTARALFHVSSDAPRVIFPTSERKVDLDTYQKTQVTMIKSRGVLEKALIKVEADKSPTLGRLSGDPVEWLEKELKVVPTGEMLSIALAGNNPDDIKNIVNAVADAYREEVVDKEKAARLKHSEDLQAIYDGYQKRLEEQREVLRKSADGIGSGDKQVQVFKHQLELERLSVAQKELMGIESELRRAQAELALRRGPGPGPRPAPEASEVSEEVLERQLVKDQMAARLRERMSQLESSIANVRRTARQLNDPVLQRYAGELSAVRRNLAGRREQVLADLREQRAATAAPGGPGAAAQELGPEALKAKVAMLLELRKTTIGLVEALQEQTKDFSRQTSNHEALQDRIAHADGAAKRIGSELEVLAVELDAPSRVVLVERAGRPRREDERGPLRMAGLAALCTFALVLTGVSWLEFLARRVDTADDVSRGLGMRIVGTLPHMSGRARRALIRSPKAPDEAWHRLLIESVDAARAMLLHAARTESHRVVMVTSALGGEGKTSLACHLATSLARAGRRTLLVDCDLRRPAAHRLFDVEAEPGFCDYLRGGAPLPDLIRPTQVENLSIIAAGRGDAVAIQALAHETTRAAFDWMRHAYDFVVVDSAPILSVADSLAIGQCVDAVIFSILRDVSRLPKVYAAHAQLAELGVRTIGAIVTGAPAESYGNHYGPLGA